MPTAAINGFFMGSCLIATGLGAVAQTPVDSMGMITQYGPMGIMLAWFMYYTSRSSKEQTKAIENLSVILVKEHRTLGHRFEGLSRTILIQTLNNEADRPFARSEAERMLRQIEEREREAARQAEMTEGR